MPKRSRGGCWTCKRRHKKCDETRPHCKRCVQAGIVCEGYNVRLTWGSSSEETEKSRGFSRPVRQTRSQRARVSRLQSNIESTEDNTSDEGLGQDSPDAFDIIQILWETSGTVRLEDLPSSEIEEELLQDFLDHGFLTLIGSTSRDSLLESDIIPLLNTCAPLRHTCLAYQANLSDKWKGVAPMYLQAALSAHLDNLTRPEALSLDTTLATGILLCSASIASLYIWTPLLTGLYGLLQHRGLLTPSVQPKFVDHLVEVIAILDIECFTLNRLSSPMNLWKTYITPRRLTGIEESSGLPYTLVDLLADLESPHAEYQLLTWMGEPAENVMQIHLWEATRAAAILQCRALKATNPMLSHEQGHGQPYPKPGEEYLRMKVFASIKALIDSDKFYAEHPIAVVMLYPLFIACIFTRENPMERDLAESSFKSLMGASKWRNHQLLWNIIVEVWERAKDRPEECRLALASECVAELNIEVYLC